MTGFARAQGGDEHVSWVWEAKSVNGRSLDVRCRLPPGMDALEPVARAAIGERFRRGHFNVSLHIVRPAGAVPVRVNRPLLDELVALAHDYRDAADVDKPRLDGLLGLRGVVEAVEGVESEEVQTARLRAMQVTLNEALDDLAVVRRAEGAKLAVVLAEQRERMAELVARADRCAALRPTAVKERLRAQVAELLEAGAPVPEERLAQELAVLATKSDIREEIDRLNAHVGAAAKHLESGGTIGRRLDFLAQEFNREANTICSKANDVELTEIGLEIKAVIDQFREQVQNIE